MLKSTLLLATALFLITAPAPDSADLAEATHGLLADNGSAALQASEPAATCLAEAASPPEEPRDTDACANAPAAP